VTLSKPPFVVACCGDSSFPEFSEVVRGIAQRKPDLFLFAGDAVPHRFGVSRLAARRWRRTLGPLGSRALSVPGNHDYASPDSLPWLWRGDGLHEAEFSPHSPSNAFVAHFPHLSVLGFDSGPSASRVSAHEIAWVSDWLDRDARRQHRVALVHAPPFPVSHHIGSSLDRYPADRDAFWSALAEMHVTLILSGHEHLYARTVPLRGTQPITQVITGGGGANLMPLVSADVEESFSTHHALLLSVYEDRIHGEAILPDGTVFDEFRLTSGTT